MSKSTSLGRVLSIINGINSGKKLNIENLAYNNDVHKRTIQRDIALIKEHLHDGFIQSDGENIYSLDKTLFDGMLSGAEIASLVHICNVFRQSGIELDLTEGVERLVKKSAEVYDIKNKPLEMFTKKSTLTTIEKAIKGSREVKIKYKTAYREKEVEFKPYKVTMLNENFYLLGTKLDGTFLFLRINMILDIELNSKTFYKNADVVEFIKKIQTPFATYGESIKTIKLQVNAEVAKYYKMKKFYNSQKIEEELQDGSIVVSYEVTNFREIQDFVIQWLPNVHILEPKEFKSHVKSVLKEKMLAL